MSSNALIRFFVAISMLAGLIIGPAAFATPLHAPTTTAVHATMPDAMDCCPNQQSNPGCAKCPLMALCSSSFAEQSVDLRLPARIVRILRRAAPADEARFVGQNAPPLSEPPRSLV